jgi:aerobic carbon-monoxide dehydrogenase small subunit
VKTTVRVRVNGEDRTVEVDTRTITADMLRDHLRLTSVHIGCATGNCGACTVFLDGQTVKSCCVLAADVDGREIMTVEGIEVSPDELHPIQDCFIENQGLQCGYCTPAMILSSLALLRDNPNPTEEEIRHGIAGNLCRCTGYHFIVTSIQAAAARLAGADRQPGADGQALGAPARGTEG